MALHWIIALIVLLPMWLLQNYIHELSHGLTLWFGWRWKFKVYPLPSKKLGRFTWAHVTYEPTTKSREPGPQGWALVSIMPKIVNSVFVSVSAFLSMLFLAHPIPAVLLSMFAVLNFVDFTVGTSGIFFKKRQTDIWSFQSHMNYSLSAFRLQAAIMIAVMAIIAGLSLFGIFTAAQIGFPLLAGLL